MIKLRYNKVMALKENLVEKEKKIKGLLWIPIVFITILSTLIIFIISVRVFTPEDTWLCKDGVWVKHGQPSAPEPTLECRKIDPTKAGEGTNTRNPQKTSPSFLSNFDLVGGTHDAVNDIPNENPIGPIQINGFFRFLAPVVDIMADFGAKVCQWGRPKEIADTCPSVKLNFQNFFNNTTK
jgi:hypothetical protein